MRFKLNDDEVWPVSKRKMMNRTLVSNIALAAWSSRGISS